MKSPISEIAALALLSLCSTVASAQGNDQEATVAVRGIVVDESATPVSNAAVSVRHFAQKMAEVRSASDGSFTIDVPRRSFDGVLLLASDERGDRLGTLVHPDQGRGRDEPVRIVLRKAANVEVKVTDNQGQFVPGAHVAAAYRQQALAEQMTDEAGRAMLRVPAGMKLFISAVKREIGLDYVWQTFESDEHVSLVLRGMVTVRVKVIDHQGQGISGAKVYPMFVSRLHEPMHAVHVGSMAEFQTISDETGVAVCHIPIDNIHYVPIQAEAEGYVRPPWVYWIPDDRVTGVRTGMRVSGRTVWGDEFEIDLKPSIVVRGTVCDAEGRPAAGASVGAFGRGYGNGSYVQGARCDALGEFKIALASDLYYVFIADAGDQRCRDQMRVVAAGREVPPLKLVLQPSRRIHGILTRGPERTPVPHQQLSVIWRDDESYSKVPSLERLPNPEADLSPIVLSIWTNGRTDEQGHFEFLVPPGRYYVVPPDKRNEASSAREQAPMLPQVDVTNQAEVRIDLHSDGP